MPDTEAFFAANEIIADKISLSYQPCRMYILLLMYQLNPQHQQFVKINGTDFTKALSFCINSEPSDHCKLADNRMLDPQKIMLVEQALAGFKVFARKHNLEAASLEPNKSVYNRKLLVEVNGSIKRYNKIVNFQKASLNVLTKHEILSRVKHSKDHHLIHFLQRLIQNCPRDWIDELNSKYGLNEIVDDIGFYNSQNYHGFLTQENVTAPIFHHPKLLTDPPERVSIDYSKSNRYVEEIFAEIKREDSCILDDNILPVVSMESKGESDNTPDEYLSCNESSSTDDHVHLNSNGIRSSNIFIPNTQNSEPSIDICNDDTDLKEVFIKGFSPRTSEKYVIKNQKTGALEITDSFEIYLEIPELENNICTLSFINSADVLLIILGNSNVCLTESYENTIKKLISRKFNSGRSYKIPYHIYLQFLEGKTHVLTSGFQFL